ncbi:hypothetical protein [Massilia sp. BJB1822]|uniref:hypothetical protein n=1 Tax=Massilia sp. BJB1822 TaxID=2744470 RepID=UPI001593837B|nr:hypothetical protein [Massilia sp. BJB1822]NVE00115.1 hypothetical protein [Massilia sp. BJB1822]
MSEPKIEYKTSTYYVDVNFIVNKKGAIIIGEYKYLDETGDHKKPIADDMGADKQDGNVDFVRFSVGEPHGGTHFFKLPEVTDLSIYTAKLYCAVAHTLEENEEMAPNIIFSSDGKKLAIPIYKGTRRGVILIFQIFRNGDLIQIVGSPDPEIGNSTSGVPDKAVL